MNWVRLNPDGAKIDENQVIELTGALKKYSEKGAVDEMRWIVTSDDPGTLSGTSGVPAGSGCG